jgi:ABC-2 type transport system ATP-binding protein
VTAIKPLSVDNLTKDFGRVHALHEVSFVIEPGEVFGYLGPNGAGKTTTLRIALGLVRASAGNVRLFGRAPSEHGSRQNVGFLPGDLHLYGDLKSIQLLDYFARFRPDRPAKLRSRLIEQLSLESSVLERRVKFLSHGTRQKLGLIVAMQQDPDLLLLDEPSNGLDPLVQQAFRQLIRDTAERGRSVLFSSHLLNEVQIVCQRVAILRQGRLVALETVDTLRARMVRRLTIRFTGEIPAGLLEQPQVARHELRDNEVVLWVRGEPSSLLRALANTSVRDFVFPEAELEDIFLSYYRGETPADA